MVCVLLLRRRAAVLFCQFDCSCFSLLRKPMVRLSVCSVSNRSSTLKSFLGLWENTKRPPPSRRLRGGRLERRDGSDRWYDRLGRCHNAPAGDGAVCTAARLHGCAAVAARRQLEGHGAGAGAGAGAPEHRRTENRSRSRRTGAGEPEPEPEPERTAMADDEMARQARYGVKAEDTKEPPKDLEGAPRPTSITTASARRSPSGSRPRGTTPSRPSTCRWRRSCSAPSRRYGATNSA